MSFGLQLEADLLTLEADFLPSEADFLTLEADFLADFDAGHLLEAVLCDEYLTDYQLEADFDQECLEGEL